ncbi:peptidoglycan editing factor PgeF [Sulfurovum sp. bin170]|uniref:peptidoglycan editing factor PgeF n=1 Tax=Sulfurovum sp. bin170 TaxID=2695268 RepID=UPI0013DEF5C6|nr:peptidoglycan editing factor PgeF [Sulfurovum sp. bin170]NEW60244.1 peptidoglycan editing factor PgeF [Sulfurovum sp. bin170]
MNFKNLSKYKNCTYLITQKDELHECGNSLALHTKENPNSILKNREAIQKKLPNRQFIVANQTHSDHIKIITEPIEQGWRELSSAIEDCDALITNQKGIMLTILTADCVPVLLFDPKKRVVSAIHAGWNGTYKEIVYKAVKKMVEEFDCNPKDIVAGIAPSIGRCCYEVGEDVAKHFFDDRDAFDIKGEKYMLDLPYVNREQLLEAGLSSGNIELSNICTACEVESYFSYRKEQGCSGRFMSMIGLD